MAFDSRRTAYRDFDLPGFIPARSFVGIRCQAHEEPGDEKLGTTRKPFGRLKRRGSGSLLILPRVLTELSTGSYVCAGGVIPLCDVNHSEFFGRHPRFSRSHGQCGFRTTAFRQRFLDKFGAAEPLSQVEARP